MQGLLKTGSSLLLIASLAGMLAFGSGATGQQKDKDKDKAAAGAVFEVYADKSGEFRFRFHEGDDKLAMSVKGYKTKEEVLKLIDTIKKEAAKAKVDDQTKK